MRTLASQGASSQTIAIVASFLRNRSMQIKMPGGSFSTSRSMPGGSPQGTKSGNILFCIAARGLASTCPEPAPRPDFLQCDQDSPPSSSSLASCPSLPLGGTHHDSRLKRGTFLLDNSSLMRKKNSLLLHSWRITFCRLVGRIGHSWKLTSSMI